MYPPVSAIGFVLFLVLSVEALEVSVVFLRKEGCVASIGETGHRMEQEDNRRHTGTVSR
jgi:hypothetical protein